jgi:Raf kinase inhibitor-like YbhB/YbcL family protein
MRVSSASFPDGGAIPQRFAFGRPGEPVQLSDNLNPQLSWDELPEGTRSVAVICHDPDVPSRGDDVNQADRTVPFDLPRVDFFHWVLVDLPARAGAIAEGSHCRGVTARGKAPGAAGGGVQGINDYTSWFSGDAEMAGDYGGYDGPCPPWNDERGHHYVFTVFALDIGTLGLSGSFTGAQARQAMEGHVLASASLTGTYHIYPDARF